MGAAVFMSIGIMFLLSIPLITSRLAKRMGRDPRIWFLIGFLLPVIATFIVLLLPDLSQPDNLLKNQNSSGEHNN